MVLVPVPGRRGEPDRPHANLPRARGGAVPPALRLRLVSALGIGFYTAYEHLAQEDLDFVLHLGDYIYEDGVSAGPPAVRQHNSAEIATLADYRNRHALYKTDAHLQAAHAMCPWIVTWDDHEVENNYAAATSEDNDIPGRPPVSSQPFLQRRANAYQAYVEHMPLAPAVRTQGPKLQLYRLLSYGQLAQLHVLDTRQFRSNQPCGGALDQRPGGRRSRAGLRWRAEPRRRRCSAARRKRGFAAGSSGRTRSGTCWPSR